MPIEYELIKEGDNCPECGYGIMMESNQRDDDGKPIYTSCSECDTHQLLYMPLPHQDKFHSDTHKYKMFAGGFGSGKTRTGAEEIKHHILETPNGMTLIGASTKPQLDQTAKDMFFKVFPDFMIKDYFKQKDMALIENGHVVIFRPLDDEGKLRSLNLTGFWIEEASEVKYDIFVQLQTRLRNKATKHHVGILTSNPDMGWIKQEFLLKADKIHNPQSKYVQDPDDINPAFSVHIAPTHLNIYLPADYVETTSKGKPEWWIKRYMKGSFEHTEGMVYPQFIDCVIPSVPIPPHWERLTATDFGLRDPTVTLAAAIDPRLGEVHIYREHYKAEKSIKWHAQQMKEKIYNEIPTGRLRKVIGDPKGKARSERDMRSTFDYYAEYEIYFTPGINKIEDGIQKVYGYMEMGKLKIHESCAKTIWEGTRYTYPKQEMVANKNASEKPMDKDNHAMDCFVAGTLVETSKGQIPIEEVKIGDSVLTREGYKKVINSGIASLNSKTIKVEFANGSVLVGTPDHLVWTENKGFVALDSLRYSDKVVVSNNWEVIPCVNQNQSSTKAKLTEDIHTFKDRTADIIRNQSQVENINTFTGKSTKIISEKFLKDGTSTTRTGTLTIIHPTTWKSSLLLNIQDFMQKIKYTTMNTLQTFAQRQQSGINQKKDESGTQNTANVFLKIGNLLKSYVSNVGEFSKQKTKRVLQDSVQTIAGLHLEEKSELMTLTECASNVEKHSESTSMLRKSIAQKSVVYNLTVEGKHEFFANGILVHNCLRYILAELPDDPDYLINFSYGPALNQDVSRETQAHLPHALQDDPVEVTDDWYSYY